MASATAFPPEGRGPDRAGRALLYLWMALLTYDPADPSWSHSSQVDQVQNAAGRLGAVSADILFMTLGYFAYLFPLLLGIKTWQVFRRRNLPWEWNTWLFSWRLVGLIFLILAGSALAYIHFHASGHRPAPRPAAPSARAWAASRWMR